MHLVISNSEITQFKSCRRKWRNEYILGYGREETSGPLALGTRVHGALASYYSLKGTPDGALTEYNRLVAQDTDKVSVEKYDDFVKEAKLGFVMLEGYFQWIEEEGADADLEILEPEEEIEHTFSLGEHTVTLLAKRDAKGYDHQIGRKFFLDHKTQGSGGPPALDLNEQVRTYAFIEKMNHPEDPIEYAIWNVLRKVLRSARAKPPFYYRLEEEISPIQIANYWLKLQGVLTDIIRVKEDLERGVDHHIACYPTPGLHCSWGCAYRQICPLADDGSYYNEAMQAIFEPRKPYARYLSKHEGLERQEDVQ